MNIRPPQPNPPRFNKIRARHHAQGDAFLLEVRGRGSVRHSNQPTRSDLLAYLKIEAVVTGEAKESTIETISRAARTGKIGDGKIFVSTIENAMTIRTGEQGAWSVS